MSLRGGVADVAIQHLDTTGLLRPENFWSRNDELNRYENG